MMADLNIYDLGEVYISKDDARVLNDIVNQRMWLLASKKGMRSNKRLIQGVYSR